MDRAFRLIQACHIRNKFHTNKLHRLTIPSIGVLNLTILQSSKELLP